MEAEESGLVGDGLIHGGAFEESGGDLLALGCEIDDGFRVINVAQLSPTLISDSSMPLMVMATTGLNVTAEAAPHHFSLTHERCDGYDTNAKMNPPLREAEDRDAIRMALADGTLDCIATDHAPHHYDAKEREFDDAPNGIVGLETALSLALRELVLSGLMTLPKLIERMSCAPARLWHLPGGTLRPGSVADLVLFDPAGSWTVDPARFRSKSRNTPWAGETLPGVVHATFVAGRRVFSAADFGPRRHPTGA